MKADDIVAAGCGRRYTAAVLRIERRGRCAFERAYGTVDQAAKAAPVRLDTTFDLASLTKIFVATVALRAVAGSIFELDAPLLRWLPEWRKTPHAAVTLRMVLAHTAGLQSGADYRVLLGDSVERYALCHDGVAVPGERVIYSDLGFIALGVLLARASGHSLRIAVAQTLRALGCTVTAYRPRNDDPSAVPATEYDSWRGRVRGAVHDEKGYLMGGVAGHAGLFGTARDVALVAEPFLAVANGRVQEALPPALVREAIAEQGADPVLRRGLGWALKTSDDNSCGAAMSQATFGHTGFTGTSLWADPERDLAVVLLTNAVYYGRHDLRDVRAAVCDAAVREYAGDTCAQSV